jgi:GNAT superfamily N-acetyltransferase
MKPTIRRAVADDTATVHAILKHAAGWLHDAGYDQWPDSSASLRYDQILRQIGRGGTFLVHDGHDPVATIATTTEADPDFWTLAEQAEAAVYVSKAAIVRRCSGHGLGALLLRWVVDRASREGARWARLDAWRTNEDLHTYYREQGWDYLRTVDLPHRRSGALFQHPAVPDHAARDAFTWHDLPASLPRPPVDVGSPVIVRTPEGPIAATITEVFGVDGGYSEVDRGWEYATGKSPEKYIVTRDGRTWCPPLGDIWSDPAREITALRSQPPPSQWKVRPR